MIRLTYIDYPHLLWPVVEASLKRVKGKTGERWSLPFVFQKLQDKEAALFAFHDEGRHIAYMVCERYDQGDGPWLNVWILEGGGMGLAQECLERIDDLAKASGCKAWRCTGRKGWQKIGLKPIATVYERVVL